MVVLLWWRGRRGGRGLLVAMAVAAVLALRTGTGSAQQQPQQSSSQVSSGRWQRAAAAPPKGSEWLPGARNTCLRGVVTVAPVGGVSSNLLQWASALGFSRILHKELPQDKKRQVALTSEHLRNLTRVFDGVEAVSLQEAVRQRSLRLPRGLVACSEFFPKADDVVWEPSPNASNAFFRPKDVEGNQFVAIQKEKWLEPAIAFVTLELRDRVRFKEKYLKAAARRLRALSRITKKRAEARAEKVSGQVQFVGVHVRHPDPREWYKAHGTRDPPDDHYYTRALLWTVSGIRSKKNTPLFNPNPLPQELSALKEILSRSPSPAAPPTTRRHRTRTLPLIAVAIVSDDMQWVHNYVAPALRSFLLQQVVTGVEVFAAGSRNAAVDLALLSQCNHTIISYGTFGAAAAILSGARTVVYDMQTPSYLTFVLAKFFPRWFILD